MQPAGTRNLWSPTKLSHLLCDLAAFTSGPLVAMYSTGTDFSHSLTFFLPGIRKGLLFLSADHSLELSTLALFKDDGL